MLGFSRKPQRETSLSHREQNTSHDNHLSARALQRNTHRKLHTRGNREYFDVTRGPPHRTPRPHLAFQLKEKKSCARRIRWREILLRRLMRRTNTTTTRSVVTRRERFPAHVTVRTRDRELVCLFVRFTRVACHLHQVWSIDHEHQLTQQICRSHSTAVRCHARPFHSSTNARKCSLLLLRTSLQQNLNRLSLPFLNMSSGHTSQAGGGYTPIAKWNRSIMLSKAQIAASKQRAPPPNTDASRRNKVLRRHKSDVSTFWRPITNG